MVKAANYPILDSGLYNIPYGEASWRPLGSNGPYSQFGDVDAFTLNLQVVRKDRWCKNKRVKVITATAIISVQAEVTVKCMQMTDFVRMASMLGQVVPFVQAASVATVYNATAGLGIYYVPALNISNVSVASGATALVAGTHFNVVDEALGGIEVSKLPDGVVDGGPLTITYDQAAVAQGSQDQITIGDTPRFAIEMQIRGVSDNGVKEVLHLFHVELAPSNAQDFISTNDDYQAAELKGTAFLTNSGIGFRQILTA